MTIKFDSSQDFQLDAIRAVVDIFDGQPLNKGEFESFSTEDGSVIYKVDRVENNLLLSDEQLLENIKRVQAQHSIALSEKLENCIYKIQEGEKQKEISYTRHFSIEMETGTGKTYTYLRTIYELNKTYGFKKFVIVVPSIPIREGVIKNLEITREHFKNLYNNVACDFMLYDGTKTTQLRNFSVADSIQILVINIDSFDEDRNKINTIRESGIKPIEYIQKTNPIVIVDEPQNMTTDNRKAAIHRLNPLCTLRYSATHKEAYNLLYSLNPVQAYERGLVKQIEVDGITAEFSGGKAFIEFEGIDKKKKNPLVKLRIQVQTASGISIKQVTLESGDDLFDVSKGMDVYKDGYILDEIYQNENRIKFSNGLVLHKGDTDGDFKDEVMKFQIEETIKWHLDREMRLKPLGIKVLTLFFVDKVANYRLYGAQETRGKIAIWFEEAFKKLARGYRFKPEEVHNGYFSKDKKTGALKDSKEKTTAADNETFNLIMRDKERLLDDNEPVRFIFSHSALKEGWDNPNVFQICTLNETKSEMKKRQEIGRGLRLPVNNNGERVFDKNINVLTVIANESYEEFADNLQKEMAEDGYNFPKSNIGDPRKKAKIQLRKQLTQDNFPLFFEIWDKIKQKTKYQVHYDTNELIRRAKNKVLNEMQTIKRVKLTSQKAAVKIAKDEFTTRDNYRHSKVLKDVKFRVPDIFKYIQDNVNITRSTIFEIIKSTELTNEILVNPQMFLEEFTSLLKEILIELQVDGIKYEKINGVEYGMQLFADEEIETYLAKLYEVRGDKTLYNYVPYDSDVENEFAKDCENDPSVKFFFKLPKKFEIKTPLGAYIPDWAVVFENDKRIYFVAETKSNLTSHGKRGTENLKISCAKKHFEQFLDDGVQYKAVRSVEDLYCI